MGLELYLNVDERPFYSGTYYRWKWQHSESLWRFPPNGGFVRRKQALMASKSETVWYLALPRGGGAAAWQYWKSRHRPHIQHGGRFVAYLHCCKEKHHTTSFLFLTFSESSFFSCGNGLFMNEEQIGNWACAVERPTMNTGPASPVISLDWSWLCLCLWWRTFITPETMTA